MKDRISNCYDSHVHFLATGQVALGLQLHSLKSPEEIASLVIQDFHYRGAWLTGFGWDQNLWTPSVFPSRKILDQVFPDTPVLFSRVDGHSSWVNACAVSELKKLGHTGLTGFSQESGILSEQDHIQALSLLPDFTDQQNKVFLLKAQSLFNQAGFTHVRDLSMNHNIWNTLVDLYKSQQLTICLESFITAENLQGLDAVLNQVAEIKKNRPCAQLRLQGVKLFVDGSLGSQTAYLSENYRNTEKNGVLLWPQPDLIEAFAKIWSQGYDIAVHCIGDQCAHVVVEAAREVSARGILGRLHLEHIEILRSETIQMMKPLHVTCYMQPCHWTSDHAWLPQILSEKLQKNIFQWELLRKNKIPFFFGSDSPIEKPSLLSTVQALQNSVGQGVPQLQGPWQKHHSHPDIKWTNSWTELDEQHRVLQVYFNEKPLL